MMRLVYIGPPDVYVSGLGALDPGQDIDVDDETGARLLGRHFIRAPHQPGRQPRRRRQRLEDVVPVDDPDFVMPDITEVPTE